LGARAFEDAGSFTGVDVSEIALRYARGAHPTSNFLLSDATQGLPAAEAVVFIDVLGHVAAPELLLHQARDALAEGGLLCLAEPKAHLAQSLEAPARQAFSESSLKFLLEGAGFRVRTLATAGGFLVARAVASEPRTEVAAALAGIGRDVRLREDLLDGLVGATPAERVARAEVLASLGRAEAAFAELFAAHRAFGEDAEVLGRLGALCFETGSVEDGLRFAAAALERDPTNATALEVFARKETASGPSEQALALWSNVARLAPSRIDVAVELARVAAENEHYHLGTLALERVRQYHSELSPDFYLTSGFLWALSGSVERAAVECALAAILAPNSEGVRELSAFLAERAAA
jgi:tetratricopeptide (TPR) repeat protein